jgi:hypothetical protein
VIVFSRSGLFFGSTGSVIESFGSFGIVIAVVFRVKDVVGDCLLME